MHSVERVESNVVMQKYFNEAHTCSHTGAFEDSRLSLSILKGPVQMAILSTKAS